MKIAIQSNDNNTYNCVIVEKDGNKIVGPETLGKFGSVMNLMHSLTRQIDNYQQYVKDILILEEFVSFFSKNFDAFDLINNTDGTVTFELTCEKERSKLSINEPNFKYLINRLKTLLPVDD